MLATATFDCLVVDSDRPDTTGTALVTAIRTADIEAPILVVTGRKDEAIENALLEAGATDYLPKDDLTPQRLARRLRFAVRVGRAEANTARALADITAAARGRDDVLAVVSHDLRGPLSAIGLACEARRDEVTSASGTKLLGAVERSTTRAERLIRDLLDVSKVENGGVDVDPRAIDARTLVSQAATDHALVIKESGGTLSVKLPDGAVEVSADRHRIQQVLANLILNALTHATGSPIEITLSAHRHGEGGAGAPVPASGWRSPRA